MGSDASSNFDTYMLDSNIFDKLIDDDEALKAAGTLVESGQVRLISTYLQRDEIERTADTERRSRLLSVPCEEVPTYGIVAGYWRIGMARLSEAEPFETLQGGNVNHTEDALIAATARYERATFVTEDRTAASRSRKQGIPTIGWAELRSRLTLAAAGISKGSQIGSSGDPEADC